MVGIYKITSPSGRIYVGQAVEIVKRQKSYEKHRCKGQPKLYASLVKYGFSKHIFEVIEECKVEELNVRERHWQDFYNVISEKGLNCKLTKTEDKSGYYSIESRKKNSETHKAFNNTLEGLQLRKRRVSNTDYAAFQEKKTASRIVFDKTPEGVQSRIRQGLSQKAFNKTAKGIERITRKVENTNWVAKAQKCMKPILQFSKDGIFVKEWSSVKEAGGALGIIPSDISACLNGRQITAKSFIWKYK